MHRIPLALLIVATLVSTAMPAVADGPVANGSVDGEDEPCEVTPYVFPPEGDIPPYVDCPPYQHDDGAPVTDGLICSFTTVLDPTAEEGTQTGQLEGGPVLFTQAPDGTIPQQGTLVCRVQVVDAFTSDHNGTGPTVSGHTNAAGVAVAVPQVVSINRTGTQNVFLCSEFVDDASGVTYYWDDDLSEWSTSSLVHCGLSVTGDDGSGPSDLEILIDSIICPVLALVFPPEGDIPGIWDCPPYGNE